ncbi:E3 ubiquitin-protein ligase CHIP-like isoform X2 [Dendronephthya gigantea]|uniref:E3 ubiquitin-protein ligase CHIP-like isoform X2 n=1 Tax=Dendronephthya gigantea TaxID=151771 RepID=UPI00106D8091|nr:E3 ubiquitin-protein ligase CHIP-like isoform X2 [Dendronephthya gigantea]
MKDFKEMTAIEIKDRGNAHFSKKQYESAIDCYSKAILKSPDMATLFTNRALCYLKLKKWDLACNDCRHALELDSNIVKGYYFLGQALLEQHLYDESIKYLQKALEASKDQKRNFGDDISYSLRQAQKRRFQINEARKIQQEIELQTYLTHLIKDDMARRASAIGEMCEDEIINETRKIEEEGNKHIAEVNELFSTVDERRKREVPDYLCGKISFEIMKDPVITPSGITYDRKDIEEHLQRVGHFDPVTRTELKQEQLIPNLAMKEVVDTFVSENEWVVTEY